MVVHAIDIFHIHDFVRTDLDVPASVENPGRIYAKLDCLESIEWFFAGLDSFDGWFIEAVNFDIDVVVVGNIESPTLEPFYIYQITDILLLLCVVYLVPLVEVANQLFLQFLLHKNIEYFSEFRKIQNFQRLFEP